MIETPQQEMVPLSKLKPADYNPRKIQPSEMEKLKASLREFGFVQPVVARRKDGLVLGGHQRLAAYEELLKEDKKAPKNPKVPVIFVDNIDDDKAKLLNLALNKISGEWDYDKLADLFTTISADVDATLSGFTTEDIGEVTALLDKSVADALKQVADTEVDPDAMLAAKALEFSFAVKNKEEAELCMAALRKHGLTGPANIGDAFVSICKTVAL